MLYGFNGDGRLDAAVTNFRVGTVTILDGDGKGRFARRESCYVGPGARGIAVGDLSGDKKADLVVAANNSIAVMLGR